MAVVVRKLAASEDYGPTLKEMKRMNERNIVLDCSVDVVEKVLEQALQVGLMHLAHSYLITSLDVHVVNLERFKFTGANITGLQLIDSERAEVVDTIADWIYGEMRYGRTLELTEKTLTVGRLPSSSIAKSITIDSYLGP